MPSEVHVLAGVIFDAENRVLLAQRPQSKDLAGLWEFPGGKIEAGETRHEALARELREELGIEIGPARPLTRIRHAYPHKTVLLDFWIVRQFVGEPRGLDGQALRWCAPEVLQTARLLPADQPMLRLIGLPEVIASMVGVGYKLVDPLLSQEMSVTSATAFQLQDSFVGANEPEVLTGHVCGDLSDARSAEQRGADFVALTVAVEDEELRELCSATGLPVYARDIDLAQAWEIGATGVSRLL